MLLHRLQTIGDFAPPVGDRAERAGEPIALGGDEGLGPGRFEEEIGRRRLEEVDRILGEEGVDAGEGGVAREDRPPRREEPALHVEQLHAVDPARPADIGDVEPAGHRQRPGDGQAGTMGVGAGRRHRAMREEGPTLLDHHGDLRLGPDLERDEPLGEARARLLGRQAGHRREADHVDRDRPGLVHLEARAQRQLAVDIDGDHVARAETVGRFGARGPEREKYGEARSRDRPQVGAHPDDLPATGAITPRRQARLAGRGAGCAQDRRDRHGTLRLSHGRSRTRSANPPQRTGNRKPC